MHEGKNASFIMPLSLSQGGAGGLRDCVPGTNNKELRLGNFYLHYSFDHESELMNHYSFLTKAFFVITVRIERFL